MVPNLLVEFNLHLGYVSLELFQKLKHFHCISLELENLRILLMDLLITNLPYKREVVLYASEVVLWREPGQQRDLSLEVSVVWPQEDCELL